MSTANLPAVPCNALTSAPAQLNRGVESVKEAIDSLKAIRTFVNQELKSGVDFGLIPGTGDKPTLLKPGAEKIALYYQTRISYAIDRMELSDGHIEFQVRCDLLARSTGATAAEGYGSCCTMESKYRWRKAERLCPHCGQPAVIKGRVEYGGGWLCFDKKGGCKAKFQDGDPAIESQQTGRIENPDVWDSRNTCLKIALKRSLVSAVLSLGSLSELYTQDIEDTYDLSPTGQERTQTAHGEAPAAKPSGKPPTIGKGKAKDERTAFEVVRDGCDAIARDFRSEFPDGLWDLSNQQVERHLLKFATNKSTEGMSNEQVRAALFDAYEGPKHNAIRKELKTYLEGKFTAARKAAVGAAIDNAGQASTEASETDDDSDPEMSIDERAPDGHQIGD